MDRSNKMIYREQVGAGLDASASHLYGSSSSEPLSCSQVLFVSFVAIAGP